MTTQEFSDAFDTLINAYSNSPEFGKTNSIATLAFDEYEKSLFLTQAQEDIVKAFYSGRNQEDSSFEGSEETRRYLNELVKTLKSTVKVTNTNQINTKSVFFALPENKDLWFIVYESAGLTDARLKCTGRQEVPVIPTTHDNLQKTLKNPFRKPNERKVLRLDLTGNMVELISEYTVSDYMMRYLSKPEPIILTTLSDGLTINGISVVTECKLNSAIHKQILDRAIQLAIISKVGGVENTNK